MNTFEKLLSIDVSKHTEKKGNFSYLSWPWAVAELRKADPKATWAVQHFTHDEAVQPFMTTVCGTFVAVSVTVDGVELTQVHPVLDNRNKPVDTPDAFQINTSIQRCLVKAIALHGLGLSVFAGEDLPVNEEEVSLEEVLEKIKEVNAVPHLKNIWDKYGNKFDGEDRVKLIMAKDLRKEELTNGERE